MTTTSKISMFVLFKPFIIMSIGIFILIIGVNMKTAMNSWTEQTKEDVKVPGTKLKHVGVGAGIGAALGGAGAATLGGIGIAACGTGIGIPAGIVMIAGALLGAGAGGMAGAMTGKSEGVNTVIREIVHFEPAYDAKLWIAAISIGIFLIFLGLCDMWKAVKSRRDDVPELSEARDGVGTDVL